MKHQRDQVGDVMVGTYYNIWLIVVGAVGNRRRTGIAATLCNIAWRRSFGGITCGVNWEFEAKFVRSMDCVQATNSCILL